MNLTILGSESLGNCYIFDSGTQILVVEAGIRMSLLKEAIGYDVGRVVGCLVTHVHLDHFKYADDYARYGINIYSSQHVINRLKTTHRGHIVESGQQYQIGEFTVRPFPVSHNVPTFGFLIHYPECGTILFATDAAYIPGRFAGVNHLMIEANYSDETLVTQRAVGSHMALDTCVNFIQSLNTKDIYTVILLHLSSLNSNAEQFKSTIQSTVPNASVHIADKGLSLTLTNNPF